MTLPINRIFSVVNDFFRFRPIFFDSYGLYVITMENNKENSVVPASKSGSGFGSGLEASSRNQIFAKKLKERRELFGLTQVELAEKIGSNKGTIQNYESGSLPKGDYAIALANILECSLDWLLMDKGPEPESPGKEKQIDKPEPLYNKVEVPGVSDEVVRYSAGMDLKDKLIRSQEKLIRELEDRCRRQADKISALKASLEAIEKRLSGQAKDENTEKKVM